MRKDAGLLGLGSVVRTMARCGKQFGMDILGVKRTRGPMEHVDQVTGREDMAEVLPWADALVVALPLTAETFHLPGEKRISMMNEGLLFSSDFDKRGILWDISQEKKRSLVN